MIDSYQVSEGQRRVNNFLRVGVIFDVDYKKALYRVQDGGFKSDWLPQLVFRAANNARWHALEAGEQVVFLHDEEFGVVIGSIYQEKYPAPSSDPAIDLSIYGDGAAISYDRKKHHFDVNLPDGATVFVRSTGAVTVLGDVIVKYGDAIIDGISFKNHQHEKVFKGKDKSGKPVK